VDKKRGKKILRMGGGASLTEIQKGGGDRKMECFGHGGRKRSCRREGRDTEIFSVQESSNRGIALSLWGEETIQGKGWWANNCVWSVDLERTSAFYEGCN